MNKKLSTTVLIAAFLTGNSVYAAANQEQVSIGVQDTLYVRIIDMLPEPFNQDFRFIDEYDRYFYLKDSVAQVFEKAEIPIETVYVRLGAKVPEDAVVLNIFLHQWRLNRLGEFETRLAAQLKAPGAKENLGVHVGRHYSIPTSGYRIIEDFQTSARQAVSKLIPIIAQRISIPS